MSAASIRSSKAIDGVAGEKTIWKTQGTDGDNLAGPAHHKKTAARNGPPCWTRCPVDQPSCLLTQSQLTSFQNSSMYLARALR